MFQQPPHTSQGLSATECPSDPTFADTLRTWVETIVPQLLAAKDVQYVLYFILCNDPPSRGLWLVAWNICGALPRRTELAAFAIDYDLDVSETFLTPPVSFTLPADGKYRQACIAQNHPRHPGDGTEILVHRRIDHRQLPLVRLLSSRQRQWLSALGVGKLA